MENVIDAGRQFASGGAAGLVEICLMHPLDLVKTRFQIQGGKNDATRYNGIIHCFRTIAKTEGITGFYKGILPPILAETPKRATKFATFEQYRKFFAYNTPLSAPVIFSLAGLFSGFTEGAVICPFEVIKVRLQSERNVKLAEQKSTLQLAKEVIKDGGFGTNGLYRGLTSTLMRHGVWNMFYFGIYHSVKVYVEAPKDSTQNFLYRFCLGLFSGTLASVVNIPFDVAKSRIQGPQPIGGRKYFTCTQTLLLVYKEEGYFALYKGLLPKVMRLGPSGAIMFIVYEHVYEFLKRF